MPAGGRRDPEARQARDVMAFGQEIGRALSDGRIVGPAEPFARPIPRQVSGCCRLAHDGRCPAST